MRFFRSAIIALAAASASASSLALKPRSLIDVCGDIDVDLIVVVPILGSVVVGHIHVCLCVSSLNVFITIDLVAVAAVALVGEASTIAELTALIYAATGSEICYYPDHALPLCTQDNPCDFDCDDGFTPYPSSYPFDCICNPPKTICNGVCGNFPHCASQKAKRDVNRRDAICPSGWSACGVWGNGLNYECVDVRKDLWSCGGCGRPLLPTDSTGVDCTAIPSVHDVACVSGRCIVERCKDGFEVSSDRSTCVLNTRTRPPRYPFIDTNSISPYKA